MSRTNVTTHSKSLSNSTFMSSLAIDPATTTGLTLGLTAGHITTGAVVADIPASTLVLTASQDNWIYNTGSNVLSSTVNPVNGNVLYKVVTDGSSITSIEDHRGAVPTTTSTFS